MSNQRLTDAELEAMRGHTPGPWRWCDVGPTTFELVSGVQRVLYRSGDKTEYLHGTINADQLFGADATLIAAATALLQEVIERRAADAKVRELVEALEAIDLRLTECAKNPDISAADAYDDFYRDCVAEAIAPYRTTP